MDFQIPPKRIENGTLGYCFHIESCIDNRAATDERFVNEIKKLKGLKEVKKVKVGKKGTEVTEVREAQELQDDDDDVDDDDADPDDGGEQHATHASKKETRKQKRDTLPHNNTKTPQKGTWPRAATAGVCSSSPLRRGGEFKNSSDPTFLI